MTEDDIMYQAGPYWVARYRDAYTVYQDGITHATADSSYRKDPDGLYHCPLQVSRAKGASHMTDKNDIEQILLEHGFAPRRICRHLVIDVGPNIGALPLSEEAAALAKGDAIMARLRAVLPDVHMEHHDTGATILVFDFDHFRRAQA